MIEINVFLSPNGNLAPILRHNGEEHKGMVAMIRYLLTPPKLLGFKMSFETQKNLIMKCVETEQLCKDFYSFRESR